MNNGFKLTFDDIRKIHKRSTEARSRRIPQIKVLSASRLDKINLNTQWFNQSLKVNKINENRLRKQMTDEEIRYA